jgi:hypothetical protein
VEIRSSRITAEEETKKKGMILPFQPLVMTFHNVNYFVDMTEVSADKQHIPE